MDDSDADFRRIRRRTLVVSAVYVAVGLLIITTIVVFLVLTYHGPIKGTAPVA